MKPLILLVVCGAPPTGAIGELVSLLQADGSDVCVIPTVSALDWLDVATVEQLTGFEIKTDARTPGEARRTPKADLVVVAPATFNTVNKWAHGINDSPTLGVLNEALGSGVPIVASPYAKSSLAAHPAFQKSLDALASYGVKLTPTEALRPQAPSQPFRWSAVLELVAKLQPLGH